MSMFEANLQALDADLAQVVRGAPEPAAELEILDTPSGFPTARYGGRYLHAKRDPWARARRAFTPQWVREHPVVVFFGFGFGYEVETFLSYADAEAAIVVEPDLGLFCAALAHRRLEKVLSRDKASFLLAAEPDALAGVLRKFERRAPERYAVNAEALYHQEYFENVDAVLEAAKNRARINSNTLRRFGRLWVRNLIRNVPVLERAPGVHELHNRFDGLPALLCAAGPSLDRALPYIAQLAERMLIVAVDTALPALMQHGIEADFAVIVDPQYWNTRHLDRLRPESSILISEASAHPRVFRLFDNPTYLCSSIFPLGTVLEEAVGEKGKLGTGGSVSTSAWDLSRLLGADPIYCIGLDLGFPYRRTHVHGSFFEERMHVLSDRVRPAEQHSFQYINDGSPFEVASNDGGYVLTDQRMMIYTWWFANQARIHQVRTVNLSPGGVAIEGIPAGSIEDLLSLPSRREMLESRLKPLRARARSSTRSSAGSSTASAPPPAPGAAEEPGIIEPFISHLISRLEAFAETAREGIRLVEELSRHSEPDLSRLNEIDAQLAAFEYKDVAGFLLQEVSDRVQAVSLQRSVEGALESARLLYEGLEESVDYHVSLLRFAVRLPNKSQVFSDSVEN
ncbi:MAG: 6-hydroxymethylpterin diphosphokinase MptE-like protein [Spirochaetia bacterium]